MTRTEILLTIVAGLGLFFFGIKMVARNMTRIAGDGLRRHLQNATATALGAATLGVLTGLVTQSGRTTAFVLASFSQAGVVSADRTIPVVAWSNLGCTLIIFVAVLPVHFAALLAIGLAGACIAYERPRPLLGAANAVFGLAVMLLGLKMMSSGTPMLTQLDAFDTLLGYVNAAPGYAFVAGFLLTLAAQSHLAIILISVPLAANGMLGFDQSLLLAYGTQAGSAAVTWLTAGHFRGEPRQAVMAHILYNLFGVALFLLIFAVDHLLGPEAGLMRRIAQAVHSTADTHVALAATMFNVVTPLLVTIAAPAFARLCAALTPPRGDEELSRPVYLREEMRDNPPAALLLVEREQQRLLRRLPDYFEYLRPTHAPGTGISPATHHSAFVALGNHIRYFQGQLMSRSMSPADTEWLINLQQRQDVLVAIEDACHELCGLGMSNAREDLKPIISTLAEATDTIVLTAIAAVTEGDAGELDFLDQMTSNRGATMETMRRRCLASSDALPPEARTQILAITSLFERAAWSLGRFGQLLRASPMLAQNAPDGQVKVAQPAEAA